jgi:hypothetical protein
LAGTAVAVLVVVAVAVAMPRRDTARRVQQTDAPHPWIVLLTTLIASLVWHAMLAVMWRVQPALSRWPLVLAPMLGALAVMVLMFGLVRRWAARRDWNDLHRLALVTGALISHSVFGIAVLAKATIDRVGAAALGLAMLNFIAVLAVRVRSRLYAPSAGIDRDHSRHRS